MTAPARCICERHAGQCDRAAHGPGAFGGLVDMCDDCAEQCDPPPWYRPCRCGSGLQRFELVDARGIFCTYVCDQCEAEKRREFRADIFTDADYECDEPVEADEW